jgi:hypothetical protein
MLFCTFAAWGCTYTALVGIYAQYFIYCTHVDTQIHWFRRFFHVLSCAYDVDAALCIYPFLAGITALSVGALATGQILMVANETSTFDVSSRGLLQLVCVPHYMYLYTWAYEVK